MNYSTPSLMFNISKFLVQKLLSEYIKTLGVSCYHSPKVASIFLQTGLKFGNMSVEQKVSLQEGISKSMISIEDTLEEILGAGDAILIVDRGLWDAAVYLLLEDWQKIESENGWAELKPRYNLVLHLETVPAEMYTTSGHSTRSESADEAQELDRKIEIAYKWHPNYHKVASTETLDQKFDNVKNIFLESLVKLNFSRKRGRPSEEQHPSENDQQQPSEDDQQQPVHEDR